MPTLDPASGRALPDSAIQRVLFVTNSVHVYQIPPLTSNKGFAASSWTSPTQPTAQQIFTARLRVIETSIGAQIKVDVVLEDANSGDLFAAAPYISTSVVQQALDSSRFFAVRVQGEGGMKATLGIGFEDRSAAFDFGIALTEARKVLGVDGLNATPNARGTSSTVKTDQVMKKDFSLKEGETIQVQVGSKGRRPAASNTTTTNTTTSNMDDSAALFSIAPPPPPPAKSSTGLAYSNPVPASDDKLAQDFGFDDGEFGEFQ